MFRLLIVIFAVAVSLALLQSDVMADDSFYKQSQKGWFWHEPAPEEEPEPEEDPVVPATPAEQVSAEDKMVVIDTKWLRENLPILRDRAIDNPTEENLGAFYSAQRVMVDISSKFATSTQDFFQRQANWLSEDHRRPTDAFMLSRFKEDLIHAQKPVMEKVSQKAGIWFFFASTCPYCLKQLPLIKLMSDEYGLNVLYVSLDGGSIPGIPDDKVVIDYGGKAAAEFGVSVTPTTYLVSNDASKFELLSNGVSSLPKLQNALVRIAHKFNWITESEFKSVQSVHGSNVLDNGLLQIKESEIANPSVLYNALQQKIDLTDSPIGTPIHFGAKK